MNPWKDDDELFHLMRNELFTAVVGDVLDANGFTHQFLPPQIRPLHPDMVILGRAMPVLEVDVDLEHDAHAELGPFGLMLRALDDLKPGEIYVTTGSSRPYALWGELMSTRAIHLGSTGAVLDGYTRDTREILKLGFPISCWGSYAQDQRGRGRVVDFRCPLEFRNGVRVSPGDILFGDVDGVVAIPKECEVEVVQQALEKERGEGMVRKAIQKGMSTSDAFEKYGIM